jgi:fibronectin type 3 domain-containing protein
MTFRVLFPLLLVISLVIPACGRKAPPTLKAYEKPQPPSGLAVVHREGKMLISWSYPENLRSSLKGFQVMRAEGQGFERLGSVGNEAISFIDDHFSHDTTYQYKVMAQNLRDVLSDGSNIVTVTPMPLPPPPQDVHVSVENDAVRLSWQGSGEGVCYHVYRTTEKGRYSDVPVHQDPVCGTSFSDPTLFKDKPVFYTIKAFHNTPLLDEGFPSAEIEVTPSLFVPSAPVEFRWVRTQGNIILMWGESPEMWVKGYRVYRKKEKGKEFVFLGETKVPTFTDTGKAGKKVRYMVKALGPSQESEPSVIEVR